jgi:hypothetical protein
MTEHTTELDRLHFLIDSLHEAGYTVPVIATWLSAGSPRLDGKAPLALVATGELVRVEREAVRMTGAAA